MQTIHVTASNNNLSSTTIFIFHNLRHIWPENNGSVVVHQMTVRDRLQIVRMGVIQDHVQSLANAMNKGTQLEMVWEKSDTVVEFTVLLFVHTPHDRLLEETESK